MRAIHLRRRISRRRDEEAVVLDLSADDDQPNVLFLTTDEAERLASDLEMEMICAGTEVGEEPQSHFAVADMILTRKEAWQLLDAIGDVLGLENADDRLAVPWWKEGF